MYRPQRRSLTRLLRLEAESALNQERRKDQVEPTAQPLASGELDHTDEEHHSSEEQQRSTKMPRSGLWRLYRPPKDSLPRAIQRPECARASRSSLKCSRHEQTERDEKENQ